MVKFKFFVHCDSWENGGYENDDAVKAQMFDWVEHIWRQKDQRITEMLAEFDETAVDKTPQDQNKM